MGQQRPKQGKFIRLRGRSGLSLPKRPLIYSSLTVFSLGIVALSLQLFGVVALNSPKANAATCSPSTNFVTTWDTTQPGVTDSQTIRIPGKGGGYNFSIDIGNDGTLDHTGITGSYNLDFGAPGTYTIGICGTFPQIYFSNGGDKDKILSVDQWGDNQWSNMDNAFTGASNLDVVATDTPDLSNVTTMGQMFMGCASLVGNGSFNDWDVSNVTNMSFSSGSFISSAGGMFSGASSFNQDISDWDTSNVTTMRNMFRGATSFNQLVGDWDTSNVTTMDSMFYNASSFNQDVSGWDTGNVTDMNRMFSGTSFNQPIGNWNTENVTDMANMFANTPFDQYIGNWDTSSVNTMVSMFYGSSFNQDISGWDTGEVTSMVSMFRNNSFFNQDISSWDTSSVTNMGLMFYNASSFNQPLDNWNTSEVNNMSDMFNQATAFNQSLANWDISRVTAMTNIVRSSAMSKSNYDATLIGWASQSVQPNVPLGATGRTYCASEVARQSLITDHGWTITGDSKDCRVPSAPQNPATTSGDGEVVLTWQAPATDNGFSITSYIVQYKPTSDSAWTDITGIIGTSHTVTSLANGTSYDFRIAAVNSEGTGPNSSTVSKTPLGAPTVPTNLTLTPNDGEVTLAWQAPISNGGSPITEYHIQYKPSADSIWIDYADEPGTSRTVTGLTNGTSYDFRIAATNSVGTGSYTASASETPVSVTTPPSANTITADVRDGTAPLPKKPTIPKKPTFIGVSIPGAAITVTVHSDPVTCTATVAADGTWSCQLSTSLPAGRHTVYVDVIYPDSSSEKLGPYVVYVKGATISNETIPGAPKTGVGMKYSWLLYLFVTIVVTTLVVTVKILRYQRLHVRFRTKI